MLELHLGKKCAIDSRWPQFYLDCNACPDYDCNFQTGNDFFSVHITITGPSANPPYLARLYCRNGKIGRFLINLSRLLTNNYIILYVNFNVRHSDIIEWNNDNVRSLGLVDLNGHILRLNMYYTCHDFQESLKKYLQTKNIKHIESYIGGSVLTKQISLQKILTPAHFQNDSSRRDHNLQNQKS